MVFALSRTRWSYAGGRSRPRCTLTPLPLTLTHSRRCRNGASRQRSSRRCATSARRALRSSANKHHPHSPQSLATPLDCLVLVSGCSSLDISSLIISLTSLRNPMVTRSPTASLRHRRVSHPPLHPRPHYTHTLFDFPWPPHLAVMWSAAVVHHAVVISTA